MDRKTDAAPRTAGKQRYLLLLGAAAIVAGALAAYLAPWEAAETPRSAADTQAVSTDTTRVLSEAAAQRPVYKYSVLPGGVGSREELAAKAANDKAAAAHYASFDIDKAHVTLVKRPRAVHVSYRKGDRIYWTKNKMMLAAGETLLSDGKSEIRGRCGNRLSDTPQLPVEAGGPDEEELGEIVPTSFASPVPDMPPGVSGGPTFTAAGTPEAGTPAQGRTALPLSAPGTIGMPGGGPIYGVPVSRPAGTPGSPAPGASDADPVPTPPGQPPADPSTPVDATDPTTPAIPDDPRPLLPPTIPSAPEPHPPAPRPGTQDPPAEVPEPGTLWLGIAGAAALLLRRRR